MKKPPLLVGKRETEPIGAQAIKEIEKVFKTSVCSPNYTFQN